MYRIEIEIDHLPESADGEITALNVGKVLGHKAYTADPAPFMERFLTQDADGGDGYEGTIYAETDDDLGWAEELIHEWSQADIGTTSLWVAPMDKPQAWTPVY